MRSSTVLEAEAEHALQTLGAETQASNVCIYPESSRLSPSGTAAFVAWGSETDSACEGGDLLLSTPADRSQWLAPVAGLPHDGFSMLGWSPSGRCLGTLSKFEADGSPGPAWREDSSPCMLGLQVLDLATANWMSQVQVQAIPANLRVGDDAASIHWCPELTLPPLFSCCETLMAKAISQSGPSHRGAWHILSVGVHEPFCQVLVVQESAWQQGGCKAPSLGWLEGCRLAILDPNACALACIAVDINAPAASTIPDHEWVSLLPHAEVAMHILPSGQITLLQVRAGNMTLRVHGPDAHQHSFEVFSAADLAAGTSHPAYFPRALHVCASQHAIAASCQLWGVHVIGKGPDGRVGKMLFVADGLESVSFSVGGSFMAGLLDNAVCVLDSCTGQILHQLMPKDYHAGLSAGRNVRLLTVAWAGPRHSQLHVRASDDSAESDGPSHASAGLSVDDEWWLVLSVISFSDGRLA